jgi:predicted ATPase
MIDHVVGNAPLPVNVRQDIIERTDGVPLFVEEMTKAVLEAENEGAAQRTVASVPSPTLVVPATLQASLMARLDRLGSAREVAQIGAAIGREFSYELLCAVTTRPEPQLASALDRLIGPGKACLSSNKLMFNHIAAPFRCQIPVDTSRHIIKSSAFSQLRLLLGDQDDTAKHFFLNR